MRQEERETSELFPPCFSSLSTIRQLAPATRAKASVTAREAGGLRWVSRVSTNKWPEGAGNGVGNRAHVNVNANANTSCYNRLEADARFSRPSSENLRGNDSAAKRS